MTRHKSLDGLLRESLPQFIDAAKTCIDGDDQGRVLGYPAATLIFAAIDAIGSYHRTVEGFTVPIDGSAVPIRNDSEHLFILNDPDYFRYELTRRQLDLIYKAFRGPLTHHAALAPNTQIVVATMTDGTFEFHGEGWITIKLGNLHHATARAVGLFLERVDEITAKSRVPWELDMKTAHLGPGSFGIGDSVSASGYLDVERTSLHRRKYPGSS